MNGERGEAVVVRTREAWLAQAHEAHARLEADAPDGATLADLNAVNHAEFCRLIEALYALGQPISQELLDLAEMRPVAEVLDLP